MEFCEYCMSFTFNVLNSLSVEIRILLIGKTGAGKSSTGNTLLGCEVFKAGAARQSITKESEVATTMTDSYRITVCDTPGIFDTNMDMRDITEEIYKVFNKMPPGPHAILITIRAGRFTEEEVKAVRKLKDIFGPDIMKYCIICVTHTDDCPLENFIDSESCPKDELSKIVQEVNGRVVGISNRSGKPPLNKLFQEVDDLVAKNEQQPCFTMPHYEGVHNAFREEARKREEELKHLQQRMNKYTKEGVTLRETDKERLIAMCRQILQINQVPIYQPYF